MHTSLLNRIFYCYEAVKKKEMLEKEIWHKKSEIEKHISKKVAQRAFLFSIITGFLINTAIIYWGGKTWNASLASDSGGILQYTIECYSFSESGIIALIVWVVFLLLVAALFFVFSGYKFDKEYAKRQNDAQIILLNKEISQQQSKLSTLLTSKEYAQDVHFVPEKYRTTDWLTLLFHIVKNGRADTLKEALNLAEQEVHQQTLYRQNQQLQRSIDQAAYQAQIAAINAQDSAAMARIDFYDRF